MKTQPLSSCEIVSGWNNSGALADVLYIYPLKKDKKTFDANKEELGFTTKAKTTNKATMKDIPIGRLTEEQKITLANDEQYWRNLTGLNEDKSIINVREIKKQLVTMDDNLSKYKQLFDHLTVGKMR